MYRTHFNELKIERSTIIGSVPDYTPLFNIIHSNHLKFFSKFNHELDNIYIPNNHLLDHLRTGRYDTLTIKMEVTYNDKKLAVNQIINSDTFYRRLTHDAWDILYDILINMKRQLKLGMLDLSKYKETFDIMYSKLTEAIENGNVNNMYPIQQILEKLERDANTEFEGYFYMETMKPIGAAGLSALPREKTIEELEFEQEQEYLEVEKSLELAATKLKLTRKTIKKLPRSVSHKFVLPLDASKPEDYAKFNVLTNKPFSFLEYNDAMFSVDLNSGVFDNWNNEKDESVWLELATKRREEFKETSTQYIRKYNYIHTKIKKYEKVKTELLNEIKHLKAQYKDKADKFQNGKYLVFLATRIASNIEKIRAAEIIIDKKLNGMRNKKLVNDPLGFFNRMVTLYFGETGKDILKDLEVLELNTLSNASFGIKCIMFLLSVIEYRDEKFKAPMIVISQKDNNHIGSDKDTGNGDIEMLKVIAGHMFIHTVTINKKVETD